MTNGNAGHYLSMWGAVQHKAGYLGPRVQTLRIPSFTVGCSSEMNISNVFFWHLATLTFNDLLTLLVYESVDLYNYFAQH